MERNDSLGQISGLVKIDTTVKPFIGNDNILEIIGSGGIMLPKGTNTERPSDMEGLFRYNTVTKSLEFYDGTAWRTTSVMDGGTF